MEKRVLLLATKDGPYSYFALKSLLKNKTPIFGVAIDKKGVGAKAIEIWEERTGGNIKTGDIYEFQSDTCPFFEFTSHSSEEFKNFIKENNIDLLVNTGTPRILKQDILDAPNIGVLNIHPSILPAYRGCTTMEWSIYNDDPVGNTAHFMSAGIDEGPIIEQESYDFKKSDSYTDIRSHMYRANVELMSRVIHKIINDDITTQSLPAQKDGKYWDVMDSGKLAIVMEKLKNGQYKYQK